MKKEEIIKALEELDVWDVWIKSSFHQDDHWLEKDIDSEGEWVKLEDVKKLIKQIKG